MFVIDLEILKEYELNISELLALAKLYLEIEIDSIEPEKYYKSLEEKNYIKNIKGSIIIREKTQKLFKILKNYELKSKIKIEKKVIKSDLALKYEIDSFIEEYRNKWSRKKPGAMGSLSSCKEKMFRWCKENPFYTKDQILKAADLYLKSIENFKYLQQADYFIYKKEGKEESSKLSAFIDEIDDYSDDDWTTKIV